MLEVEAKRFEETEEEWPFRRDGGCCARVGTEVCLEGWLTG